jgi:hypothetical protein
MRDRSWQVIVEPMLRANAEVALQHWLESESRQGRTYSRDVIREDVILASDRRTLVRFSVPADAVGPGGA